MPPQPTRSQEGRIHRQLIQQGWHHHDGSYFKLPAAGGASSSKVERLLIILPGGLGDVLVVLPALIRLMDHFPHARVTFSVHPPVSELLRNLPRVEAVEETLRFGSLTGRTLPIWDPENLDRLSIFDAVVAFSDRERRLNEALISSRCPSVHINHRYDAYIHGASLVHRRDYAHAFVEEVVALHPRPLLSPPDSSRAWARERLRALGISAATRIAVHPGSGNRWKRWPSVRFGRLCREIARRDETDCLLVGGPEEGRLLDEVNTHSGMSLPFIADGALSEMAAVLQEMTLFVGNDSGLTHLAASVGTPTVTIYGPSNPAAWNPWASPHLLLTRKEQVCPELCTICYPAWGPTVSRSEWGDPEEPAVPSRPCIEAITIEDVLAGIDRILRWRIASGLIRG